MNDIGGFCVFRTLKTKFVRYEKYRERENDQSKANLTTWFRTLLKSNWKTKPIGQTSVKVLKPTHNVAK